MKTTIDIPDALYKKAKIRAVERGQTLKQIVLDSLIRELESSSRVGEASVSYWANRSLRPDFKIYWDSEPLVGAMDSTQMISEERDAR